MWTTGRGLFFFFSRSHTPFSSLDDFSFFFLLALTEHYRLILYALLYIVALGLYGKVQLARIISYTEGQAYTLTITRPKTGLKNARFAIAK